jgi:uncharacterized protein involved in exopolysaccharide biosynthesis
MEQERNILDYLYVVVKWRRLIVLSCLAVSLVTAGLSLILPKVWTARAVIMPPEEEFDQFNLSALQATGMPANLASLAGGATPADRLKKMLETNRLRGVIVDRFKLVDEYEAPHREQAIEIFAENTTIELEREGSLVVEVTASTAESAAAMANAYIGELDLFNRHLKSQQARMLREFLEERMELRRRELQESGRALLQFKQKHGMVDMTAQIKAIFDVAKYLVQELAVLEVKLEVIDYQVNAEHEKRRQLGLEREALRKQLQTLTGDMQEQNRQLILGPPLQAMAELDFENTMLILDLTLKREITRFLGTKLEEARYKEALNTSTLQVLDEATLPKSRSAPRRTLMVLIATGLSLVLSTVLAFVFESWSRIGARNQEKVQSIKQLLRPDR